MRTVTGRTDRVVIVGAGLSGLSAALQLAGRGRHDPCVLPRAVPIVDAMTSLVLADLLLRARANRI